MGGRGPPAGGMLRGPGGVEFEAGGAAGGAVPPKVAAGGPRLAEGGGGVDVAAMG
jgi:hypothetical protein